MEFLDTVFGKRYRIQEKRLGVCNSCEHFVKNTTKCKLCGCMISYKSLIMSAECPIGKWGKEE